MNGQDGVAYAAGSAAPEPTYRPKVWVTCSQLLDLIGNNGTVGADGIAETLLTYELLGYSDGDIEVSCSASIGSAQAGSEHAYYPAGTKGAAGGTCSADANIEVTTSDNEAGFWLFAVSNRQLSATYKDATSHPFNEQSALFNDSDCHVKRLADDLTWSNSTLSDVLK